MELPSLNRLYYDFKYGLSNYYQSFAFIRKNRLWEGLKYTKWLMLLLMFVGTILFFKVFGFFMDWLAQTNSENIDISINGQNFSNLPATGIDFLTKMYFFFTVGGFKYVVIIFTKVFIIHFAVRTQAILEGMNHQSISFKQFLKGQYRTIKLVIIKFFKELLTIVIVGMILSIIGVWEVIKTPIVFTIQCYFLGLVLMDTYTRLQKMSIKESSRYIYQYAGIAIAIGLIFHIMLFVPIVGVIVAPCTAAVAATLALHGIETGKVVLES